MTGARQCLECGAPLDGAHKDRQFCKNGNVCKRKFMNRRLTRGAQLYDLYMAHRFERAEAAELKALTAMNRLASHWHGEDAERRAGRRSWLPIRRLLDLHPWLRASGFGSMKAGRM